MPFWFKVEHSTDRYQQIYMSEFEASSPRDIRVLDQNISHLTWGASQAKWT